MLLIVAFIAVLPFFKPWSGPATLVCQGSRVGTSSIHQSDHSFIHSFNTYNWDKFLAIRLIQMCLTLGYKVEEKGSFSLQRAYSVKVMLWITSMNLKSEPNSEENSKTQFPFVL